MQAPPAPQAPVPNVAAVQPAPLPVAPVAATTYRESYLDPQHDAFGGNYINLYNEYAVGNTQPLPLRNSVYRAGNSGTLIHCLVHVKDPNGAVHDPGTIVAIHRLTRHDPRFGQLPLPYDNMGLGFFGDTQNGQVPTTVHVVDAWYNQTAVTQVPTAGLLAQEFAAHPADQFFGPYLAGAPDTTPVVTRPLILVPNKYAAPFLTTGMTPRDAYQVLMGMIQQDGNEVACEPLLDWLRATLTLRGGAAPTPITCVAPATPPFFVDPATQQAFTDYRVQTFYRDFPQLQAGHQHQSAVLIAQGLTTLTDEQRQSRLEAQQHHADRLAPKKPSDLFGPRLERLMKWCQVASEADLPPIYALLAKDKKRGRIALQVAVEDTLETLHYTEDFPVSTNLANKIQELKWSSALPDNLSLGLHLFSLGSLDAEVIEEQRLINQHADALYAGEASPALLDIVTVHDTKQDVCVPRTFAQLRYLVERSEALWTVLLGSQHPVPMQHRAFRDMLVTREQRLELISTRDPTYRHMVPALLGRTIQIEVNHWLQTQARTALPVAFASLTDVFIDIDRHKQWEPVFPPQYMSVVKPTGATGASVNVPYSSTASTAGTTASTLSTISSLGAASTTSPPTSAPSAAPAPRTNTVVRQVAYNESIFGRFKALGHKAQAVKAYVRKQRVAYPENAAGNKMCMSYHVIGVCNDTCRQASDHIVHTAAEDETLRAWCEEHFKIE